MTDNSEPPAGNPLEPNQPLKQSAAPIDIQDAHPQEAILPSDSAVTKAEKVERHGDGNGVLNGADELEESPSKRRRLNGGANGVALDERDRVKGSAPIKAEFLIDVASLQPHREEHDDDAAEAKPAGGRGGAPKHKGQNHSRQFGSSRDALPLCSTRTRANEFAAKECRFGSKCKFEHDLRKYLREGKRTDLETFNGQCPVFEVKGRCGAGWKCRFASSHSKEIEHSDGRKELVLVDKDATAASDDNANAEPGEDEGLGVTNVATIGEKINLRKKKQATPKSDKYLEWLNSLPDYSNQQTRDGRRKEQDNGVSDEAAEKEDNRAQYVEPPLLPSEKRRIYYGPETPVLAPLTTQGNLPFRRLCVGLGAQITWSEMAMGLPLLQGDKGEWALMKAHESELLSPKYSPKSVVEGYNNEKDIRFGAQIAANKPWLACKTTEVITDLCPHLRAVDLNCGCPIDLVYRQGAGSALLDTQGKLEKTLRGMNLVSGEVPITVKIRMGTKDKQPNADRLCSRLVTGGMEANEAGAGPAGVAAITLHGRSRQQRYSRAADWSYISECASLITKLKGEMADKTDTVREPDARDLSASVKTDGLPYFCGNGDILSYVDYNTHIAESGVDSIMIGRGALIKPWIFEEIERGQYLDKSATERLAYIEQFARYGMEHWGSDEIGVGTTRRFLLEWLSFSHRYIPEGVLEYLPQKFGDRPPAFRGRSDLETLLSSANYKDWIKISEMFLGPAHKDFRFEPKHKSNSYEIEAEG